MTVPYVSEHTEHPGIYKNYKEYMEKQQKIRLLQNMYKQNANMNVGYQAANPGFPHMFNYPQQINMPNIPMYPVK